MYLKESFEIQRDISDDYQYVSWKRHKRSCAMLAQNARRALQWCHNEQDGILNHRRLDCLLHRLFKRKSKKTSKFRITDLCQGNPPVIGGFSNAENGSIWWHNHGRSDYSRKNCEGIQRDTTLKITTLEDLIIVYDESCSTDSWWRHQTETFPVLLSLCAGKSPVTGEFPAQRPVTRSVDGFFDLHLNKRLSKQSWGWWFETPSCSLWRHCNVIF